MSSNVVECGRMSCMHCIVYALHSHIVSWCLLPGDQLRLAWEHLRPASFCYMDAVQASSDLLTGQEIHRTTWTCFNMLHHASDILHQDNKVAQAGTSTSRFTPRGASILAMQKKKTQPNWSIIYAPLTVLTIDCKPCGAGIASIKNAKRLQRQHPTEPFFPPSSSMWNPIQSLENSVKGLHSHPFWVTCKETKEHAQLEPLSLNSHLSHLMSCVISKSVLLKSV